MSDSQRHWIRAGALAIAFLLPLAFNPFASFPFEATKVNLFRGISCGMLSMALLPSVLMRRRSLLSFLRHPRSIVVRSFSARAIALPIAVFGIVYVLATAFSIDRRISWFGRGDGHGAATTLLLISFFIVLSPSLNRRHHINRLISIMVAGSVPVALYGWVQHLGLDPMDWKTASISPVLSTMGRSVYLGAYLAMIIPFTVARSFQVHEGRWRQLAYLAVLLLQTTCLTLTLARGAWLGLVGGLILFWLLWSGERRQTNWGILLSAIVIILALVLVFFAGDRILRDGPGAKTGEQINRYRGYSNSARIVTWEDALKLIPHRWILGYGPESYPSALEMQEVVEVGTEPSWWHQDDPHNSVLWLLTSLGIAGLLAYLWMVVRFFRAVIQLVAANSSFADRTTLIAILSSTSVYLIATLFNPDVIVTATFFWLNLGMGAAMVSGRANSSTAWKSETKMIALTGKSRGNLGGLPKPDRP